MVTMLKPNFAKRGGLVTVVAQDARTKEVLMVASANEVAWRQTLLTGKATYFSTSRGTLWVKGEESGNTQLVDDVLVDCDGDALVYIVNQVGEGACHTKARSCFYRSCIGGRQLMEAPDAGEDEELESEEWPDQSYVETPSTHQTLRFLLPTGSLSVRVRSALVQSGYALHDPDRTGFCGRSRGVEFFQRDRRMVPLLVNSAFHAGITGKDLVLASGVGSLREVAELPFSRASSDPTRWVLATNQDLAVMNKVRVGCELPLLAEVLLAKVEGLPSYEIVHIEGSEESAIGDGLCDAVLVVTESGNSLTANGISIVEGCDCLLQSYPQVLAKPELPPILEKLLRQVTVALQSAVQAADRVMIICDMPESAVEHNTLPAVVAPTVSPLSCPGWVALQICTERCLTGEVLEQLSSAGAKAIAVQELIGYLP